jgi:RimJ/RimL family protein N-acetyltransferase
MPTLSSLLPSTLDLTVIRPLSLDDLARFREYRSSEELARYQGWSPMSEDDARAFVQANAAVLDFVPGSWLQLGIADGDARELIGDIGLFLDDDGNTGELGFTLSHGGQGRGHATRAVQIAIDLFFRASDATVVRAVTDTRNLSSIRVLERAGFTLHSEQESVFKGEACVEHVYVYPKGSA